MEITHSEKTPSIEVPVSGQPARVPLPVLAGSPAILVVDDACDVLMLWARILSRAGAAVVQASSVAEALQVLGSQHVDAVVTDLSMPGADGFELLHHVRSGICGAGRRTVPVIAVTGHSDPQVLRDVHEQGFSGVLIKPVAPAALIEAVATALQDSGDLPSGS